MMLIALIVHINDPYYLSKLHPTQELLGAILMFPIQITVIYLLHRLNKLTAEVEAKELLQQYADSLKQSYDDLAGFKHDYYNHVNILFFYCQSGDFEGLRAYVKRMSDVIQVDRTLDAINLFLKDKLPCLYGIVAHKSMMAAKSGIAFEVDIKATSFELRTMSEFQLNRIVSNLLSNAVEHAGLSAEKKVKMQITNYLQDKIKIEITNSTDGPVDLTAITKKGVSGKKGHTGFGLYEVSAIVRRQFKEGFYTTVEFGSTEHTFTATLLV